MEKRAIRGVEFSAMTALAALAVLALVGALLWKAKTSMRVTQVDTDVSTTEVTTPDTDSGFDWQRAYSDEENIDALDPADPDGIQNIKDNVLSTLLGSYVTMKETGTYTETQGEAVAESIGRDVRAKVSFTHYSANDVATVADNSAARMLSYRNDMRIAFEPLLKNEGYELTVFAAYIDSGNKTHLETLESAAGNYKLALDNALKVKVPGGVAPQHVGVLNALSEFHAVLVTMIANADDPFAAAALLRSFNTAEQNVFLSFNALASYLRTHTTS